MGDIDPVELPINGILDLHTFHPRDVKELVPHYIETCQTKGITSIRIIHGKGIGTLREIVHNLLRKEPDVINFQLGDETSGGWGATLVTLRKKDL
jgi:DNA-nicking Smr family endonuclease